MTDLAENLQQRLTEVLSDNADVAPKVVAEEIVSLVEAFYGSPAKGGFEEGRQHGLTEALNAVNNAAKDGFRGSVMDTAGSLQARAVRAIDHIRTVSRAGARATEWQRQWSATKEDHTESDALAELRIRLQAAQEEADYWRTSSPQSAAIVRADTLSDVENMMRVTARQKEQMRKGPASEEFTVIRRLIEAKKIEAHRIDQTHAKVHAEAAVATPLKTEPWRTALGTLNSAIGSVNTAMSGTMVPPWARKARYRLQRAVQGALDETATALTQEAEYDAQQTLRRYNEEWGIT